MMSSVERFPVLDTSQFQKERVVGPKGRTFSRWAIKELNETLYLTYVYGKVMEDVLQEVFNAAARTVSLKPKGFFAINPTNTFNAIQEDILKVSDIALPILQKALTAAQDWIKARRGSGGMVFASSSGDIIPGQNAFLFEYGTSRSLLQQKRDELRIDALGYIFAQLPVERLGPTSYSEEDLVFLNRDKHLLPNPEQLTCFQYAFLKAQEPEACADICANREIKPSLGSLVEWGYESVETPDQGDLVAYVDPIKMQIQHLGIFTEDHRVESRWGFKLKETYRHQLFDVPFNYGNTVVFMRKSVANFLD